MVNGDRLEVDHPDALAVRDGVALFAAPGRACGVGPRERELRAELDAPFGHLPAEAIRAAQSNRDRSSRG
jgi:hypothetical protein